MQLKPQSESAIVSAICTYLKAKNYLHWRQNNVGIWDQKRHAYRLNKNTMKGVPDIFLIREVPGSVSPSTQIYGIEVKAKGGKQSPEQKIFQEKFEENGGVYLLVKSLDDLIKLGF